MAINLVRIRPPHPPLFIRFVHRCCICRPSPGPTHADKRPAPPLTVVLRGLVELPLPLPLLQNLQHQWQFSVVRPLGRVRRGYGQAQGQVTLELSFAAAAILGQRQHVNLGQELRVGHVAPPRQHQQNLMSGWRKVIGFCVVGIDVVVFAPPPTCTISAAVTGWGVCPRRSMLKEGWEWWAAVVAPLATSPPPFMSFSHLVIVAFL